MLPVGFLGVLVATGFFRAGPPPSSPLENLPAEGVSGVAFVFFEEVPTASMFGDRGRMLRDEVMGKARETKRGLSSKKIH